MCSRILLIRCLTRSDLRFPLAMESPVGTSHFFSLLLCLLLRLFCQDFVGCSLVFILVCLCLRSFLSSPSSSSLVRTSLSVGGVLRSIFSAFSFRSTVLGSFVALVLPVLCFSSDFLCGVFCGFLHSLRVLPEFLTRIVPLGFVRMALIAALFRCALLPCESSSYCLFWP